MVHDKLFNATILDYMKSLENTLTKALLHGLHLIYLVRNCITIKFSEIAFHHIHLSCEDHSKQHIHLVMIELQDLVLKENGRKRNFFVQGNRFICF